MTPYRDRLNAGHYAPDGKAKTTDDKTAPKGSTTTDQLGGLTGGKAKTEGKKP